MPHRLAALSRRLDLPLTGIVLGGFLFAAFFALRASEWVVMTDELVFAKAGLSVAETFSPFPTVRGDALDLSNRLYPLVTAPVWALLGDVPGAFRGIHLLNALLMASAAVPAFLLARTAGASLWAARLAAALTVFVPWLAYSMVVMTEPLGYVVFAWAALAVVRALAAPSLGRDAVSLLAIGVAALTRTQFIVLLAAFAVAAVLLEVAHSLGARTSGSRARAALRGVGDALRSHLGGIALLAGFAALVLLVLWLLPHESLDNILIKTGYQDTAEGSLLPEGWTTSAAAHYAYVALGTGVAPAVLAMGWALSSVASPGDRSRTALAVLLVVVVPVMVVLVTSFNLRFATLQVQDRYLFYVVPLLFAGAAACLCDPRRRWLGVGAAGAVTVWFLSLASYEHTLAELPRYASPDAVFHKVIDGRADWIGKKLGLDTIGSEAAVVALAVVVVVLLLVALTRARRGRLVTLVGVPVLAFCVVQSTYVLDQFEQTDASANWGVGGGSVGSRDWIDAALPDDTEEDEVALIPSQLGDDPFLETALWWDTEFWNRTVGRVYSYEGLEYDTLPKQPMEIEDEQTGLITVGDEAGSERWLVRSVADTRFRPRGRLVTTRAREGITTLEVIEPERPWRADWVFQGLTSDGYTRAGSAASLRLYPTGRRERRRIRLTLKSPRTADIPFRFTLGTRGSRGRGSVAPQATATADLTTCVAPDEAADVVLDVRGSTNLPEKDELVGLRVTAIEVTAARGC